VTDNDEKIQFWFTLWRWALIVKAVAVLALIAVLIALI